MKKQKKKKKPACIMCKRKKACSDKEFLMIINDVPICSSCACIVSNCLKEAIHTHIKSTSEVFPNSDIKEQKYEEEKETKKSINITPKKIKAYLDRYVVSQDRAKEKIAIGAYSHYKRITNPEYKLKKENILIVGPTGTGKTEIARHISNYLDVPVLIRDVTNLTESGYVGNDIEDIFKELLICAGGDIKKAEKGIIFLDEIDKLSSDDKGSVSRQGVQQSLLKVIEGDTVHLTMKKGTLMENKISLDTRNILFIASGAFEGITKEEKKGIGFEKETCNKKEEIVADDLIKYGMLPEFIGRFPILAQTKKLEKEDLLKILTQTDNCILKEYKTSVGADGFCLEVEDDVIRDIIDRAYIASTGARSLKTYMNKYMETVLFEIPSLQEKGKKIIVSKYGYKIEDLKESEELNS